jgi:threonine/homoserine/homoserine lactone efflux protein
MLPHPSSLLLFVTAALVLLLIPGPAVFYIVGRSIGHGRGAGLVSALGISVGSLVHTAAAAVGLSALLMSSAVAFAAVKYLGAAYLIYLGIQKIRCDEPFELSGDAPRVKLGRVFGQGIVVNVLNPKAALFFFAFLPQFVDPSRGHVATQILFLGTFVRAARPHDRYLLGRVGGHGGQSFPAQRSRHAYATIYQRRDAHFAGSGDRVRGFDQETLN